MTKPIHIVTGATGTLGREIVAALAAKGERVRALVRDASKARRLGLSAELAVGDLTKPDTLRDVFAGGASAVILANGNDLELLEANAMEAARAAGVGHVVKISGRHLDAEFMAGAIFARVHSAGERRLRRLGACWTIIRPALFASNFALWLDRERDALTLPAGQGWDTPVDPRDLAEVVAHVLTTKGHDGAIYEVTGPERILYREAAARMARMTGRAITLIDVDPAAMRAGLVKNGVPEAQADTLIVYFDGVRAGALFEPTQTVAELLARPARRLDDWLRDHLAALT